MTATCILGYRAFITCDGLGMTEGSLVLGPETTYEAAAAHIASHGGVCTGLGNVASGIPATCQAKVNELYEWKDV